MRHQDKPHEQLTHPFTGYTAVFKYHLISTVIIYYPQHSLLQIQVNVQVNKIPNANRFTDRSNCPRIKIQICQNTPPYMLHVVCQEIRRHP